MHRPQTRTGKRNGPLHGPYVLLHWLTRLQGLTDLFHQFPKSRSRPISRTRQVYLYPGADTGRAATQNDNGIGQKDSLINIVRHEQNRCRTALPHLNQFFLQGLTGQVMCLGAKQAV